jgi:hypothetical protein
VISSVGTLGAASDKNSGTTLVSIAVPRDVPAGAIVVLWLAWDSVFSVITPDTFPRAHKITDDAGNVYTIIAAETDPTAFFLSGSAISIAISQLRSPLTSGDLITVEGAHAGTLAAKAISAWEFEFAAGKRWARAGPLPATQQTNPAGDPGGESFDTELVDREWLFLYGLGSEGPDTDAFTLDADYTPITSAGTTGGADDSNVSVRGGWRIASQQADSVSMTSDTADRDNAQAMTAVAEVRTMPFPRSVVLDDFNRADEDPVDGGTWDTLRSALGGARLEIVGNQAQGNNGGGGGFGGSFWDEDWEGCQEVFATYSDFVGRMALHLNTAGDASTTTMDGYGVGWWATDGNAVGLQWATLSRSGNAGRVASGPGEMVVWLDGADGHKIGIQRLIETGTFVHHLWANDGSGWEEHAAQFTQGIPGPILTLGEPAMDLEGGAKADDFGGSEVSCFLRKPQIMRYR